MPLEFQAGQNADSLELSGKEKFTISLPENLSVRQELTVKVRNSLKVYSKVKMMTQHFYRLFFYFKLLLLILLYVFCFFTFQISNHSASLKDDFDLPMTFHFSNN